MQCSSGFAIRGDVLVVMMAKSIISPNDLDIIRGTMLFLY